MGLRQTVAPAKQPVTLRELKTQLRIEADDEKVHLESLIAAAVVHVESLTRRQLITATWELTLDRFPQYRCGRSELLIPRPRLRTAAIAYIDGDGDSQTWDPSKYRVDTKAEPGRIEPAFGQTWPSTRRVSNAVTVTFTSGYGDEAADVPINLCHAVKIVAAFMAEHRGADLDNIPAVDALVAPYVIPAELFLETMQ